MTFSVIALIVKFVYLCSYPANIMKRAVAILLTTLYTFLSLGLVLHVHFCGNKLANISLSKESISCCSDHETNCCAVKVNCCENLELRLAIDEVHQAASGIELPDFISIDIEQIDWISRIFRSRDSGVFAHSRGSPTLDSPLYLKFCRLTYYG